MLDQCGRTIDYLRLSVTDLCNYRCQYCMPICREEMPPVTDFGNGHEACCWLHDPRAPKVEADLYKEAKA